MAKQQDTEIHIFGSGCLTYSWWRSAERNFEYPEEFPFDAPDGWEWAIKAENPTGPGSIEKVINHAAVMRAVRKIVNDPAACKLLPTGSVRRDCRTFLKDPEDADFDADSADCVLQVAVFGEVIFG